MRLDVFGCRKPLIAAVVGAVAVAAVLCAASSAPASAEQIEGGWIAQGSSGYVGKFLQDPSHRVVGGGTRIIFESVDVGGDEIPSVVVYSKQFRQGNWSTWVGYELAATTNKYGRTGWRPFCATDRPGATDLVVYPMDGQNPPYKLLGAGEIKGVAVRPSYPDACALECGAHEVCRTEFVELQCAFGSEGNWENSMGSGALAVPLVSIPYDEFIQGGFVVEMHDGLYITDELRDGDHVHVRTEEHRYYAVSLPPAMRLLDHCPQTSGWKSEWWPYDEGDDALLPWFLDNWTPTLPEPPEPPGEPALIFQPPDSSPAPGDDSWHLCTGDLDGTACALF